MRGRLIKRAATRQGKRLTALARPALADANVLERLRKEFVFMNNKD
jgi:hypothetical protein